MSLDYEKLEHASESEKTEAIINDIYDVVKNGDSKEINNYIDQISKNIKNILRSTNSDRILYMIVRILNKIAALDPTIRISACENLDMSLASGLEDIKLEKEALLQLQNYLKGSKKAKKYDDLPLAFVVLIAISAMHNNRTNKIVVDTDIWKSGIKGISYIPATPTNSEINGLREPIEQGIQKLKVIK